MSRSKTKAFRCSPFLRYREFLRWKVGAGIRRANAHTAAPAECNHLAEVFSSAELAPHSRSRSIR